MVNRSAIRAGKTKQQYELERYERRERVLTLTRNGLTYREIAEELGISKDTVSRDLEVALREFIRPAAEEIKNLFILRAEWLFRHAAAGLIRTTQPIATDESAAQGWHRQALQAMERGAKLEGVDAPRKLEITEITDDMLLRELARYEAEFAAAEARGELTGPPIEDAELED